MTDDQQRAREQFKEWAESSGKTVHGFNRIEDMWDAWQAATTALRAAPEGWELVPSEIMDKFPEINPSNYGHDDVCELNAWGVELVTAARPQGVRDAD